MPIVAKIPMKDDKNRSIVDHIWVPGERGEIYCYRYDKDVILSKWFDRCSKCPYFAGTNQGEGIECAYGKNAPQLTTKQPAQRKK